MGDVYYNGCWGETGHYLWDRTRRKAYSVPADFPVAPHVLDSGFLPPGQPQVEGRATLCHVNGWTVLAFWDRSVDTRGKSNSAFVARGTLDFDAMVAAAKAAFPSVWGRFGFEVRLADVPAGRSRAAASPAATGG